MNLLQRFKMPRWAFLQMVVLWSLPVFAVIFTVYIFQKQMESEAHLIEITFEDASGVQAEKTAVRFRGVDIGYVKSIGIPIDNSKVLVSVALKSTASHFAVAGSKFWIVRPNVSLQGITGIETLIEGSYIAVKPGSATEEEKNDFQGSANAEMSDSAEYNVPLVLQTSNAGSINEGDQITFRGLKVGQVMRVILTKNIQYVELHAQIFNRYAKLLRTNSIFVRKMAIQAKLGLFSSEIKVGALNSLMNGGIEIYIPTEVGPRVKAPYRFELVENVPKDVEKWQPILL